MGLIRDLIREWRKKRNVVHKPVSIATSEGEVYIGDLPENEIESLKDKLEKVV